MGSLENISFLINPFIEIESERCPCFAKSEQNLKKYKNVKFQCIATTQHIVCNTCFNWEYVLDIFIYLLIVFELI